MKSCVDYVDGGGTGRMGKIQVGSSGCCVDGWGIVHIKWTNDELEGRMNRWRVVWITLVKW
jgi:hypothetical protein